MSYARITIDGDTILDTNLNQTSPTPPAELAKLLTPQARSQPGMNALLLAFATAAKNKQNITIDLTNHPHGYQLTVDHQHVIEATSMNGNQ
jgi:hypothetical protein